ncbi:hypothetical protein [Mesorhizobium sp.]|uniref:hypothetical protein n=1 Tax=Mesorhizobium sp. TaxID=1871066 RepID=UPI000FE68279|nr:hypothetical protein [Mesorhizobium sp.]RWB30973.1 MAG: hypothetical protein EOQ43_13580 [Mesorhizobium sp.]RWB67403.1 MAG: hypothetical protein EOQ42_13725 [Mesorhizobium sp.]RWC33908.1 MAG: hypothetical protein EOS70_14400 [Mesorhizobium sp.]RWD20067.1 MAG: hypothetical protein EOS57_10455 [Mesorhizobium sp.]RWD35326.1 MAG: hypothetical protein EOS34_13875 [Mesorhizobium sp.]
MARGALHVAVGAAAGAAGMGAVAAWGSSPQSYLVSCRPEGTKTEVVCGIAANGRLWSLYSGWYLHADAEYPDWKVALGRDCSDRYREYRDYVDTAWEKIGKQVNSDVLASSDPRFYFDCYSRVQN